MIVVALMEKLYEVKQLPILFKKNKIDAVSKHIHLINCINKLKNFMKAPHFHL